MDCPAVESFDRGYDRFRRRASDRFLSQSVGDNTCLLDAAAFILGSPVVTDADVAGQGDGTMSIRNFNAALAARKPHAYPVKIVARSDLNNVPYDVILKEPANLLVRVMTTKGNDRAHSIAIDGFNQEIYCNAENQVFQYTNRDFRGAARISAIFRELGIHSVASVHMVVVQKKKAKFTAHA